MTPLSSTSPLPQPSNIISTSVLEDRSVVIRLD
jgi:hypothetical protein